MSDQKVINLGYRPRAWQKQATLGLKGKRYGCWVCSRQIGKTVASIAILCQRALQGPPNSSSAYLAPAQTQARRIAWPELKQRLKPLGKRVTFSETQLKATLPGDRTIYVLGAESGDNLRGASYHTIVCDERDNIGDEFWRTVMLPTLNAYGDKSFVLFTGTLAGGMSPLWRMYCDYKDNPDWSCTLMPASKAGVFTDEWLAEQRLVMGDPAFLRELECDPNSPVENSVLGRDMAAVEADGRVRDIPYRLGCEVMTSWDLGVRDFTTVWGYMLFGGFIEVLFYREFHDVGVIDVMADLKSEFKGYRWGEAALPHDAKNRDKTTANSVKTAFLAHWPGYVNVEQSAPNPTLTLHSTRANMPRVIFDRTNCERGISRLKSAQFIVQPKTGTVTDGIKHDDNSHCLDAFRLGMWRLEALSPSTSGYDYAPHEKERGALFHEARYFE